MAVGSIVIDLLMKTGSFVTDAGKAERSLKNVKKQAQETGVALDKLKSGAAVLGGALASALSVNAIIKYADAWSDMKSVVGASIGDMSKSGDMMKRLVDIANASYSPISQTVDIYTRNVTVLQELGKTAGDAADFTESLNHMLVLTATRGERAASVQNALSKAMAVGKLQADGLETVLANGGEVAQALANELGTTVNGLRALAAEGKITSQVIADAIIKPLDDVRDRSGEMPATVGDAFTRVQTNVTELIGTIDEATGASSALAENIISFADNIRDFSDNSEVYIGDVTHAFDELLTSAKEFEQWVDDIAGMFGLAMSDLNEQTDGFTGNWSSSSIGWGNSFSEFVAKSLMEAQDLMNFFAGVVAAIDAGFSQLTTNIVAFFGNAWLKVKQGAADALNGVIGAINAVSKFVGGGTIELIKVDGGGADGVAKSISQAIKDGFAEGKKHFTFGDQAMARYADYVLGSEASKIYKDNFGAGDTVETLPAITASAGTGGGSGRGGSGRGGRSGSTRAPQQRDDAAARYIQQLNEQIALVGKATEYEKALTNIQLGKYGELTEMQERDILIRSQVLDMMREQEEREKEMLESSKGYWEEYLESAEKSLTSFDDLAANMLENFTGNFGNAFEKMVFDSESLGDSIGNLAEGMARSVVNALGQMAAQWLAYQAVQMVVGKSSAAASTAMAAATGTAIAAAYAPAAAMASLASFGANSVPAMAGITATASLAQGLSLVGMAHDGIDSVPKTGTWLLEKGERVTKAETSARLDSVLERIDKRGATGGGLTVNLIENPSRAGQVEERTNENGEREADIFVADIMGDGRRARALERAYGLQRVGA